MYKKVQYRELPTPEQIDHFNTKFKHDREFANRAGIQPFNLWQIRQKHGNAFKRWTMEEERQLMDFLHDGVPIPNIAHHMERSVGGIKSRIEVLHNRDDHWGNLILPAIPIDYEMDLQGYQIHKFYVPTHRQVICAHVAPFHKTFPWKSPTSIMPEIDSYVQVVLNVTENGEIDLKIQIL